VVAGGKAPLVPGLCGSGRTVEVGWASDEDMAVNQARTRHSQFIILILKTLVTFFEKD
jgi:hypothetical protein